MKRGQGRLKVTQRSCGEQEGACRPLTVLLFGQFIFIERLPCDDLILPRGAPPGEDGENGDVKVTHTVRSGTVRERVMERRPLQGVSGQGRFSE